MRMTSANFKIENTDNVGSYLSACLKLNSKETEGFCELSNWNSYNDVYCHEGSAIIKNSKIKELIEVLQSIEKLINEK